MENAVECNTCHKKSLSLLFLRPSPIAKIPELAPNFSDRVVSDSALMAGLLPSTLPTQSRFVLRLLRMGYIYIYIENPPAGIKNWLVYRVTEKADIVPHTSDLFYLAQPEITCSRREHNAAALKLVVIPQAHKIPYIWAAFSANLWNENLRSKNACNPQVMQKISLFDSSSNNCAFTPSAKNLRNKVLECVLGKLVIDSDDSHDFPFNSIVTSVENLADTMKKAAASHPLTNSKEIAVVLRDPVGIAAELNALRIHRNELIKKEINKPENLHPLNSSNTILGLRKSLVKEEDVDSYEQVSPLRTEKAFLEEQWPKGTVWQELTEADRKMLLSRTENNENKFQNFLLSDYRKNFARKDLGRVFYPDNDERAEAWTRQKADKNWKKLERFYDEAERAKWVASFNLRMKTLHYDPLKLFETDWRAAVKDPVTIRYFETHFDPDEEYQSSFIHNPNLVYVCESHSINTPAPFSNGELLQDYVKLLSQDIQKKQSVVPRAMAGNNKNLIDTIVGQFVNDSSDKENGGMRDKTYDVFKGISELNMSHHVMSSHAWISNALALFSFGHLAAFSGALFTLAASKVADSELIPSLMAKLAGFSKVQKFMEFAVQGTLKSSAPKMPLLVTSMINVDEALEILRKRCGQDLGTSRRRIRAHGTANRMIAISVLTDTDAYKAAHGNLNAIARDPRSGTVKISAEARREAVGHATGTATIISQEHLFHLYEEQATASTKLANSIRTNILHAGSVLKTVEARLALGSMIIQTIGIWNAIGSARDAKSSDELMQAYLSLLDSGLGFISGALQLWSIAAEATALRVSGPLAAARSGGIGTLKFLGNFTGVAGGILGFMVAIKNSKTQRLQHNDDIGNYYLYSGIASAGTSITSFALSAGTIASTLEARGIGGVVVRTVATRFAANAVIGTVGGVAFTVSGIGLVLMGTGLVFSVAAIVLTPTEFQQWLGRSYFGRDGGLLGSGKRNDMFKKGDWKAEKDALDIVIKNSEQSQKEPRTVEG